MGFDKGAEVGDKADVLEEFPMLAGHIAPHFLDEGLAGRGAVGVCVWSMAV